MSGEPARRRKEQGLYLTPVAVADFMAQRLDAQGTRVRILDPAVGAGVLCCAAVEALVRRRPRPASIELVAYEVEPALAALARLVLRHLADWARPQGVRVTFSVVAGDFLAKFGRTLQSNGELSLGGDGVARAYDAVIANPPYFKLSRSDPRAVAVSAVVHGQPNIYTLFMAVSGALLRQGGSLVFITPRSFTSGSYFRKFRAAFLPDDPPQAGACVRLAQRGISPR